MHARPCMALTLTQTAVAFLGALLCCRARMLRVSGVEKNDRETAGHGMGMIEHELEGCLSYCTALIVLPYTPYILQFGKWWINPTVYQ